jgi:HAD superfamily hydrolase (TIGR01490 family)
MAAGSGPAMTAHRAVFLDVDGTLTTGATLRGLLEHIRPKPRAEPTVGHLASAPARLRRLEASGASRAELARSCYRLLAGQPAGAVAASGREWFDRAHQRPDFFHRTVRAAAREHANRGDLLVLVSWSYPACLAPLARHLRADAVLGSTPRVASGVHTGEVAPLLVGAAKGAAVRRWMAEHGLPPADCSAYGAHACDLSMLLQVGDPVVVGDDPLLAEYADRHGWRRLPGARDALPAVPLAASY